MTDQEIETPEEETPEVETVEVETPEVKDETAGLKRAAMEERKKRQIIERERQLQLEENERLRKRLEERPKDETPPDIDAIVDKRLEERERERKERETVSQREARLTEWRETMTDAQERHADIDLNEALDNVGRELASFGKAGTDLADDIIESEKSWDVLAYLQQNPKELAAMKNMRPSQMGRELARIESMFGDTGRKVSSAPDPIKPMGSNAAPTKDPDKMSPSEYEAYVLKERGGVFPRG